ncbi:hypothetical protein C8R46DRAFT_1353829 [Mycena filopes]|nr:hypothetical protein C8R46DRAFT_1353829 [Mycena filopes]
MRGVELNAPRTGPLIESPLGKNRMGGVELNAPRTGPIIEAPLGRKGWAESSSTRRGPGRSSSRHSERNRAGGVKLNAPRTGPIIEAPLGRNKAGGVDLNALRTKPLIEAPLGRNAFVSQLFNIYSLIIAAIISVNQHTLTKPHTVVALALAASPFSIYLVIYVLRSLIGNQNRLSAVFGKGQWLNRLAVLTLLPIWVVVLVFSALPQGFPTNRVRRHHDRRFAVLFLAVFVIPWGTAIFLQRCKIWKKKDRWVPWRRIWRKVVDAYPFIQFCTVIGLPHFAWIVNLEVGIMHLLHREGLSLTRRRILALLVTIPPLIQLCKLLPRLLRWFLDLTWVRLVSCRRDKPYLVARRPPSAASEMAVPLGSSRKSSYDSLEDKEAYDSLEDKDEDESIRLQR